MACENQDASTAALAANVAKPLKVSGDAGSFEMHPLSQLIAADRYLAAKCAATSKRRGLRFNRLVPDGTVQRDRVWPPGGNWNPWR